MVISKITDPQAKAFIEQFLRDREINKEFYKRVPEDKFDFRMVNTPQRKSDSHEILHQGWNLAIMDHLAIERFPALQEMWGE